MLTVTLFNETTGDLGPILSVTDLSDLVIPDGYDALMGAHEIKGKRLDLETMQIVDRPSPPPRLGQLRDKRNRLLDDWRWTIMPDSPLANQDEWLAWLRALQALLIDVTEETTTDVVFPEKPALVYT